MIIWKSGEKQVYFSQSFNIIVGDVCKTKSKFFFLPAEWRELVQVGLIVSKCAG